MLNGLKKLLMEFLNQKINSEGKRKNGPFFRRRRNSKSFFFQPKLTIGPVDDPYEREADAVADKVMRMNNDEERLQTKITPLSIQRKCAECEEEEKQLQRKDKGNTVADKEAPSIVNDVIHSSGKSLDTGTKSSMENRFGYDFSNVKIHTDSVAAKSAQSINALAYTTGSNIVFNEGQYSPGTESGQRLLAHELTHVVQQTSMTRTKVQRQVIDRNVVTTPGMLTRLGITRQDVIDVLTAADADAISFAQTAEDTLTAELANAVNGDPVDANAELILNEELGLSFNNPAQHNLIRQQIRRFRTVRETLESGYLRYLALGIGSVPLVGCMPGDCTDAFAFSCPGNRLIVLCESFWTDTNHSHGSTLLHEPFHIWFHMARHAANALRRADASCFESFALRLSNVNAPRTCAAHTAG